MGTGSATGIEPKIMLLDKSKYKMTGCSLSSDQQYAFACSCRYSPVNAYVASAWYWRTTEIHPRPLRLLSC
ncbi:hypothetical protein OK016_25855 [Vibrio chagasii]|nr:hypothetical protein [Vibrio chagasii]